MKRPQQRMRWDAAVSLTCLLVLLLIGAFIWGYAARDKHIFPYSFADRLQRANQAQIQRLKQNRDARDEDEPMHVRLSNLWFPADDDQTGVVIYEPEFCSKGYTLFSDCTASAYLIDMEGNTIHEWHLPFSDVWPEPTHIFDHVAEELIYWRKVRLFPNGDLLAIYEGVGQSPYGGGLVKINKDSELIWKADINAHHDLDIDPDGRIFVLTHRYEQAGPRIADYISVLSPEGMLLESRSLYDVFKGSDYAHVIPPDPKGDYLHSNGLQILTEELVRDLPWCAAGDVLLTHRQQDGITLMDGETRLIKWAFYGVSYGIHDAEFLPGGRIVFFDDGWHKPGDVDGSRVVEYDLHARKPDWIYSTGDERFYSNVRGSQQKLPNGNYLITESTRGRLLEVTRDKRIVWKYVTSHLDGISVGALNAAERYRKEDLPFLEPEEAL